MTSEWIDWPATTDVLHDDVLHITTQSMSDSIAKYPHRQYEYNPRHLPVSQRSFVPLALSWYDNDDGWWIT